MSWELAHLEGSVRLAHLSLVYLSDCSGGFDFVQLRLGDELDGSREEFCEGVFRAGRRDN